MRILSYRNLRYEINNLIKQNSYQQANTRGADKPLARPGRKQTRKHVRDARDFNNIVTRAVIKFYFYCKARRLRKFSAILTETLACFLLGRTKVLSAPLYFHSYWRNSPIFNGARGFTTVLTTVLQSSLSWDRLIHSTMSLLIYLRSILILSPDLSHDLPRCLFSSLVPTTSHPFCLPHSLDFLRMTTQLQIMKPMRIIIPIPCCFFLRLKPRLSCPYPLQERRKNFCFLLTVHLSIILATDQLNTQVLIL